jgi:hypothetical protein
MTAIEPAFDAYEAAWKLTEAGYAVTADWIKKHLADIPHIRTGRNAWFTDALLAEFVAQNTRRPTTGDDSLRPVSRRR